MTEGDTRGSDSRSHGGFDRLGVPFWGSTIRIRLYSVFRWCPTETTTSVGRSYYNRDVEISQDDSRPDPNVAGRSLRVPVFEKPVVPMELLKNKPDIVPSSR